MAFVSRAERDTSVPAPRCTDDKVGPGSYSLLPERRVVPSVAPFSSNTKRSLEPPPSSSTAAQPGSRFDSPRSRPPADGSSSTSSSGQQPSDTTSQQNEAPSLYRNIKSSSFASSTRRFTPSKEAASKPGPGTYQTVTKWRDKHPAAPKGRLDASKQVSALLGPAGAAAAAVALAAVQAAAKASSSGGNGAVQLAGDVPLLTPPSIPARHQSYGYEQGPGGLLLMQPPPAAPAVDAAGEGAAQAVGSSGSGASAASKGSNCKGTAWGASRTDRWGPHSQQHTPRQQQQQQEQQRQQQQRQGPDSGSYQVDCAATRFRLSPDGRLVPCRAVGRGSFNAAGSAAFLSRVARPHQQEPDPERCTPGPGAYLQQRLLRPQSAPQAAHSSSQQQQQQQLFGRLPGRDSAIGGLPGVVQPLPVAPGPGAYDLTPTGALARTVRSSRASLPAGWAARAARAAATHVDQDAGRGSSIGARPAAGGGGGGGGGFGSTSSRFADAHAGSPGPGKYTADQAASMAAEAARKAAAASKRGAFGSATDRFAAQSSGGGGGAEGPVAAVVAAAGGGGAAAVGATRLGPGCCKVDCGVAKEVAAAAVRPSPGFVSCSQRFVPAAAPVATPDYSCWDGGATSLRGDAARLGPGAYLHLDDWGSKGAGRACTAAGGLKCSTGGTHGRHLAYHVAPFGSEASRSSPAAAAAATATTAVGAVSPGPGAYDAPVDLKQVFRPLSVPGVNRAGFSASGRRFCSSATVSPGPGAYAADSASSCSLVRPSFNVTLD